MSKELAHQKRVQAALSTTSAIAGLSALGTKGGAAAARRLAKPAVASKLALKPTTVAALPKAAEHMDKFSLGALTVGAGVGGTGGLHFAALQRAEAKQQEKGNVAVGKSAFGITHISKAVYDLEAKRDEAAAARARTLGQRAHRDAIAQGRFLRVDQDPDYKAPPPQRRALPHAKPLLGVTRHPKDFGGINPEAKRQRRMQAEEAGMAGAAIATGTLAGTKGLRTAANTRQARASERRTVRLKIKAENNRTAAWVHNEAKPQNKPAAAHHAKNALGYAKAVDRSKAATTGYKALARTHGRQAALAGGVTAALAGGAAGVHHLREKGQGRKYTDWWDG